MANSKSNYKQKLKNSGKHAKDPIMVKSKPRAKQMEIGRNENKLALCIDRTDTHLPHNFEPKAALMQTMVDPQKNKQKQKQN